MNTRRMIAALALALPALVLPGCQQDQVSFHDDLDFVFDFKPFDPFHPPPDELHSPYVTGARFHMYAYRDHDGMDLRGSEAGSRDPAIFDAWNTVASQERADFECEAMAPGETTVVLYRSAGSLGTWGRAEVEVADPDRVDLTFAGAHFIDADPLEYRVQGPVNILQGGLATFLVEYRDAAGRRLAGNGVLEAYPKDDGVDAWADQTYLVEDREWLRLKSLSAGDHKVDLKVAGRMVATITVHAVQPDEIAFIELRRESESGAHDQDILAVLALGYQDGVDGPELVYGIEYDWSVDGWPQPGEGDLFKYEYDGHARSSLEANYNGKEQRTTVHGDWGWVDSTNHIGCASGATPGRAGTAVLLVAAGLAVVIARRRRPGNDAPPR